MTFPFPGPTLRPGGIGMPFLLGSAYAVSAGLMVYGIERDILPRDSAPTIIIAWAVAGLVLALLAVVLRRPEK